MSIAQGVPAYRRHRRHDRSEDGAYVVLSGKRIWLGTYGSRESHERYRRMLAEWEATGRRRPPGAPSERLTVTRLCVAFWEDCQGQYEPGTLWSLKYALRRWRALYGTTYVDEFGPLALRTVIDAMVQDGLARPTINKRLGWIKAAVRWAVERELVPGSVHHALTAVRGLRRGRSAAPEPEPVRPVADAAVEATLRHLSPTAAAMVRLQRLTGMRPSEVCNLTTGDLDTSGDVWVARLREHKTAHHGVARTIAIGPRGQAILRPLLRADLAAPIFSPAQSEAQRAAEQRRRRKTPMTPSQIRRAEQRAKRSRRRPPGAAFTRDSYRRAVHRACDAAFPPPEPLAKREGETKGAWRARLDAEGLTADLAAWRREHRWSPNQLRHSRATELRKRFGLDAAGVALGHRKLETTQIYAERDLEAAMRIARQTG